MNIELLTLIIKILSPIIIAFTGYIGAKIIQLSRKKVERQDIENTIFILFDIAHKTVKQVYQIVGEKTKHDHHGLNENDILSLKHTAMVRIKESLPKNVVKHIPKITKDLDIYLDNLIESIIYDLKRIKNNA